MNYGEAFRDKLELRRIRDKSADLWRKTTARQAAKRTPLRGDTFNAWGDEVPYFVDTHNVTWRNERCVEIPLARNFLARHDGACLEFGNVLSHYGEVLDRVVVDRYEIRSGVENVDIVDYRPSTPFDRIVSISTVEHVGWDKTSHDAAKAVIALDHLRALLTATGAVFVSIPLGHNPALDEAIVGRRWDVQRQARFVRQPDGRWRQSTTIEVVPWGPNDLWPPSIWVAELGAEADR